MVAGAKKNRPNIPRAVETRVLEKSARRCALCFGLHDDISEKIGQIAHVDQNRAHVNEENLAFLCLPHHSLYDSTTRQHKNYTESEVKQYRAALHIAKEKASLSGDPFKVTNRRGATRGMYALAFACVAIFVTLSVLAIANAKHETANREHQNVGGGGRGGSATVTGIGTAIGGPGGGGGPGGRGGDGGGASVVGSGFAMGGEGGEAGQIDRGGRGGRSPLDLPGLPDILLADGTHLLERVRADVRGSPPPTVAPKPHTPGLASH